MEEVGRFEYAPGEQEAVARAAREIGMISWNLQRSRKQFRQKIVLSGMILAVMALMALWVWP